MSVFRMTYAILHQGDDQIDLIAEIDRPTLREALAQFYDECSRMLKYVDATELDIEEPIADGGYMRLHVCAECLADDEQCMLCGGDGVAPESE